jgi:MFS family permease
MPAAPAITAPFSVLFATILQEQVPADMRGRVFGLDTTIGVAGMPLGVMIAGFLIEGIGLRGTLLIQSAAFVSLGLALLMNPAMSPLRASIRGGNRVDTND